MNAPEELASAAGELLRAWGLESLAERITIEYSERMSRSLGITYPTRTLIRLSAALRHDGTLRREVLAHELAHLVVHHRHGRRAQPHGSEWRKLMRSAGYPPRLRLEVPDTVRVRMAPRRRFLHRCPRCRASRLAGRRMRAWRCRRCLVAGEPGRLTIERLPG